MKEGKLKVHFRPTHYHLRAANIAATNADFEASADLIITEPDKKVFADAHKHHNDKEFNMSRHVHSLKYENPVLFLPRILYFEENLGCLKRTSVTFTTVLFKWVYSLGLLWYKLF